MSRIEIMMMCNVFNSSRTLLGMICGALIGAHATAAHAQGVDEFGAYGQAAEPPESPQDVALEVRFGPYLPDVDDEFSNGAAPFDTLFGDTNRYLIGLEVDWQALRIPHVGTLGPGFGIGYTTMDGQTRNQSGALSDAQETSLNILPMYLAAVLRVDVLARKTPVPLVPYGKLGLGAAMWWTSDGIDTSRVGGTVGRDTSWGYQYALGAMLLLDVFDDESALELDSTLGVNSSYLFFELYGSDLDGFNSGDQMQVGTHTWFTGLAFEI
jgi:hypothetical protein